MMNWVAICFALFIVTLQVEGSEKECISDVYVNGCSIPLGFPFPYKEDFTPACNKHDVCYSCGKKYGWTRKDCDNAFREDMKLICRSLYTNDKRTFDNLYNAAKVGKQLAKWPFVSGDRNHCIKGAKIYYMSVDFFAESHYAKRSPKWCNHRCVIERGDATTLLKINEERK